MRMAAAFCSTNGHAAGLSRALLSTQLRIHGTWWSGREARECCEGVKAKGSKGLQEAGYEDVSLLVSLGSTGIWGGAAGVAGAGSCPPGVPAHHAPAFQNVVLFFRCLFACADSKAATVKHHAPHAAATCTETCARMRIRGLMTPRLLQGNS